MIKKYLLILMAVSFILTSVFIAIEASASGAEMRKLTGEETMLLRHKGEFEEVLVKGLSTIEIEQKSVELGFAKPENLVYLNDNESKNQALTDTLFH